jgi:hypothetical protein
MGGVFAKIAPKDDEDDEDKDSDAASDSQATTVSTVPPEVGFI